jgi:putative tryptophan/tyrosine transport system substrate-binding protein
LRRPAGVLVKIFRSIFNGAQEMPVGLYPDTFAMERKAHSSGRIAAMKRREFIALVGCMVVTVASPRAACAQQNERVPIIAVLMGLTAGDADAAARLAAFRTELGTLGWIDGHNVRIEVRWTSGDRASMQEDARELVALTPNVFFGVTVSAALALLHETRTIPIIFAQVSDPIGSGLIEKLANPGGNVTGFTNFEGSMSAKWLELLKEIAPGVDHVGFIFNPDTAAGGGTFYLEPFYGASGALHVEPISLPVRSEGDVNNAVSSLSRRSFGGLIVMPDAFTLVHRELIVRLAAQYRIPAVYPFSFFGKSGGLLCYGVDPMEQYPKAAVYVDRLLKGAKVDDLPVQQPTKFELAINLRTARALGLTIPDKLLATADEVIE